MNVSEIKKFKYFNVRLLTDLVSQNQLNLLRKYFDGCISPLHDECFDVNGNKVSDHFVLLLICRNHKLSRQECRAILDKVLKCNFDHLQTTDDLDLASMRVTKISHRHSRKYVYDFHGVEWFGYKRNRPKFLRFSNYIFTKSSLKKQRGWTDRALRVLPPATDTYHGRYRQEFPAWHKCLIEYYESVDPVKSILEKKLNNKKKRELANKKRRETIARNKKENADRIDADVIKQAKMDSLDKRHQKLALMLTKLTVLNHLQKYLSDFSHFDNTSKRYSDVCQMYASADIYGLKTRILGFILRYFRDDVKLSVFIPDSPDKINVRLCTDHLEDARFEGFRIPEYIDWNFESIKRCPHCRVSILKDYYTCYNFAINLSDNLKFDYHVPYSIGRDELDLLDKRKLPKIHQFPNEVGPFQFGRESDSDELDYVLQFNLAKELKDWMKEEQSSRGLAKL